ncbi:aminoglycoside phosphotransferase family protein [Robbsia sp. Bb-Pol-6]|uniref:Aminoglycoside phosphotransferase family protein n=1 Tax=Robbsia betulipollinis TaxID=2981849 RepID=A0ABT3ZIF8_9BURK|nr:aminoglycoside phosphotransferase family protein [Robbsia betulipollinis]MCY0386147.1 aminoglycoside phosphotransferase family protein [Robbsia betulipollinis]
MAIDPQRSGCRAAQGDAAGATDAAPNLDTAGGAIPDSTLDSTPAAIVRAALRDAGLATYPACMPGPETVASPMRLAAEWQGFFLGDDADASLRYAKVLRPEMRELVDFETSARASRCAGETAASPRVVLADAARGVLVFEALAPARWRWARIDDLTDPVRLAALWHAKRAVHAGPRPACERSPHADMERLSALCARDGIVLPADAATIGAQLRRACAALRRTQGPAVPLHGDGVASNVMIDAAGQLQLIDFDRGGLGDPWYDVGIALNELYQFEDEWRHGVVLWQGRCDDADYARCRLYALVDDWIWTLSALWLSACGSPAIDFMKLAQWTLLRCRQSLNEGQLDLWLQHLEPERT